MGCFTFSHFFLGFGLPFFVLLNLLVELLFYCCFLLFEEPSTSWI